MKLLLNMLPAGGLLSTATEVLSALTGAYKLGAPFISPIWSWYRARVDSHRFLHRPGAELLPPAEVRRAIRYYVPPSCQSVDPTAGEEPHSIELGGVELFRYLDDLFSQSPESRYLILLADSGMGKTSALINYWAWNARRWVGRRFKLEIIYLGLPNADELIAAIDDKPNTILLLDALDEDSRAIEDHEDRMRDLMKATRHFQRVLITCRTQFFATDKEIPDRTGIIKIGPRAAGEPAEYKFHKIYLSPFTDKEVGTYLKRRYPFWRRPARKRARRMCETMEHLAVRPMLLAHIDDLVKVERNVTYSFELYGEMIEAWLKREEGPIRDTEDLRQFSEHLAVDLHLNRERRGAERIPKAEIKRLADDWNIPLDEWGLSSRSLLNRDAAGNYKFAHRSVMEYLFVRRFISGDPRCRHAELTDQMKTFLWEMIEKSVMDQESPRRLPSTADHDPAAELQLLMPVQEKIDFIHTMMAHGISLLGPKFISNPRSAPIMITLAAMCSVALNPTARGAMRTTLWFIRTNPKWVIRDVADAPMPIGTYGQCRVKEHHALYYFNQPDHIRRIFEEMPPGTATSRLIDGRLVVCLPVIRGGDLRYMLTAESDEKSMIQETYVQTLYRAFKTMPRFR